MVRKRTGTCHEQEIPFGEDDPIEAMFHQAASSSQGESARHILPFIQWEFNLNDNEYFFLYTDYAAGGDLGGMLRKHHEEGYVQKFGD